MSSQNEISSLINLGSISNVAYPEPTSDIDQEFLQAMAGGYYGVFTEDTTLDQGLLSLVNIGSISPLTLPQPTDSFDQGDLQHLVGGYSDIAWVYVYPDQEKVVRHLYKYDGEGYVIGEDMAEAADWVKAVSGEPENIRLHRLDVKVVNDEDNIYFRTGYSATGSYVSPSSSIVRLGTTVIFQAVIPDGYTFKRWLRNDIEVSTENPASIKILANNTVIYAELEES
ncbi:MAG: hypothetical protein PQJ59_16440 [Spirochaetales bacterium]|nr:hypothetical protein [Spirochaetales bacterium]